MSRLRIILLAAILLVCAASFWWAHRDEISNSISIPTRTSVTPRPEGGAVAPVPLRSVHLAVLNGTGESGLARRFSRRLSEIGCVVVSVGDAPHDTFAASLLINRRLTESEARQLAVRMGGVRLLVEWDGRCREDAVLVLGADHEHLVLMPDGRISR